MPQIRPPSRREPLGQSGSRSERLRNLVAGGEWTGNDTAVLIYWSPEGGGRWVMWEDPDPLGACGVTL